jgi:hypothetical protein
MIDGVVVPALGSDDRRSLRERVSGKEMTRVHTDQHRDGTAILGMYLSGEVIIAQSSCQDGRSQPPLV